MKVVVIIPFRGSGELLGWTLAGYAEQVAPCIDIEVRVGGDGCPVSALPAGDSAVRFYGQSFPRVGAGAVRNGLLEGASGDVVIFGNADARPAADMVQRHVHRLSEVPAGSLVLGAAPWEMSANPGVFDVLLAETPMIFFYHQMAPGQFYDFRQGWTLNLGVRFSDWRKSGGFIEELRPVYYEDIAWAQRILGGRRGVYYDADIIVTHRHPMTLERYLNREELLGLMAPVVARYAPQVFALLFGNQSVGRLTEDFRQWVAMDESMHRYIYERMQEWSSRPASCLPVKSGERERVLSTIYQMHIPLKRLAFRLGFLKGLELVDGSRWLERQAGGLWKKVVGGG